MRGSDRVVSTRAGYDRWAAVYDGDGNPLTGPRLCVIDDGYAPERVMVSRRVGIRAAREKP